MNELIINKLKKIIESNKFQAMCWQIFNGIIAILITYLTEIGYAYILIIAPILNLVTKELNRYFNPNY
jgi:hypothetical protein